jgi:FAD dependent oxidoreductase
MSTIINTDVVILGGGSAGIAAAVAAARKGLNVIIIERNNFIGGKATAAEVGTICGLYKFSKEEKSAFIVKGFAKEFAEKLQAASQTQPLHNMEGLHYLPYNINAFAKIAMDLLNENKVTIYFNAVLQNVSINNGQIESISVIAKGNPITIQLKAIVDCSGDSIISQEANLPIIKSDNYQAAAQVFTLQGVTEQNEAKLGMIMMKALQLAINDDCIANFYDRVYIVQGSLKNNCVSLKIGVPLAVTYAPGNLQELKTVAHSFVENLCRFLISNVAAFKNASLQSIAPEVGIRVGQRTIGKYIITKEDVIGCKKYPDAVANCTWPIEVWEQNRRVKMNYFSLDDFYQIPAGCLQSDTIVNLFIAGRNISATDDAIASARVMGICLQTGFAAGYMAAATALQLSVKECIKHIQNEQL